MGSIPSLRDKQIDAIVKLLNLNNVTNDEEPLSDPASKEDVPVFKVLLLDDFARSVISSVLRISDLRKNGITVHLNIGATRQSIDVPAIYLVSPALANVQTIVNDLSRSLYASSYINFLSPISRPLLEDLAAQAASTGASENISSLWDQYLNFIVTEPDLFSLGLGQDPYWAINSGKVDDETLDTTIDNIVSGLFSVAVTMGNIPIIRCPKEGAAAHIAAKLDRKLRDHILSSKDNIFSASNQKGSAPTGGAAQRPVLAIVDRHLALDPIMLHSWTYQSLVFDVFKMRLNQITVEVPKDDDPSKGHVKRTYDLTPNDFFWRENANLPFPDVAENLEAQVAKYQEETNEITRKAGVSSIEELETDASAKHLQAALSKLPELQERKATLDMHMSIATSLLKAIGKRNLNKFYELETDIQKVTKPQMLEHISSDMGDEPMDKFRLFVIWYLKFTGDVSAQDLKGFEEALTAAGVNDCRVPLAYIKSVRGLSRVNQQLTTATSQPAQSSASNELFRGFSRLTDRFKDAGLGSNLDGLVSGIKNLGTYGDQNSFVTKITESLMDPQSASSNAIAITENYLYYDPRSSTARGIVPSASQLKNQSNVPGGFGGTVGRGIEASFGQKRQAYNEAIVFMVGGGNVAEYSNLQEWAKRTSENGPRRRVIYGSTEMLRADEFLTGALTRLGSE